MRIALLGATGNIGRRVLAEALERHHEVTAVARDPSAFASEDPRLIPVAVNATDAAQLEAVLDGQDAVVNAVGPSKGEPVSVVVDVSRALAGAAMRMRVRRVLIVGGAGSLTVEPGLELVATRDFPQQLRPIALAHREALEIWRRVKELDWTYVSPPLSIVAGARTGQYRTGHNDLLVDENGDSRISTEDLAFAIVDELEHHAHVRERVTFAY